MLGLPGGEGEGSKLAIYSHILHDKKGVRNHMNRVIHPSTNNIEEPIDTDFDFDSMPTDTHLSWTNDSTVTNYVDHMNGERIPCDFELSLVAQNYSFCDTILHLIYKCCEQRHFVSRQEVESRLTTEIAKLFVDIAKMAKSLSSNKFKNLTKMASRLIPKLYLKQPYKNSFNQTTLLALTSSHPRSGDLGGGPCVFTNLWPPWICSYDINSKRLQVCLAKTHWVASKPKVH